MPYPIIEDDTDVVEEHARLRRPRLAIVLPVVIAAAVVLVGVFGAKPSAPPAPPIAPPGSAALAVGPSPLGSPGPSQAADTRPHGLATFVPGSGVASVDVPDSISSSSMATQGRQLFYIAYWDRIDSIAIAPGALPETLVRVPYCQFITQLAVSGPSLFYVVSTPLGSPLAPGGCFAAKQVNWTIWRLDLKPGGDRTRLAQGVRNVDPATGWLPVHLAVSDTAFAFERPVAAAAARGGSAIGAASTSALAGGGGGPSDDMTVEVHALDGSLLWSTTSHSPIDRLMLGGSRLAVLTGTDRQVLEIADQHDPHLRSVVEPATGASLSPDGVYVTFDLVDPRYPSELLVAVRNLVDGESRSVASVSWPPAHGPRPVVGVSQAGPQIAFYATLSNGDVAPAFVDPAHPAGGLFLSPQSPAWLGFTGDDLVWVATDPVTGVSHAYAADLPTATPAP